MLDACNQEPFATAKDIIGHLKLDCSFRSVQKILQDNDRSSQSAAQLQHLTESQCKKRFDFAKEMVSVNAEQIVFSDETTVQNHYNGRAKVRRPKGSRNDEKYVLRTNKIRKFKVNLWGFISPKKFGVFLNDESHDSNSYLKILEHSFLPEIQSFKEEIIFMQDNAAIHKTKKVMTFLKVANIKTLDWPPYSPDLNPIVM